LLLETESLIRMYPSPCDNCVFFCSVVSRTHQALDFRAKQRKYVYNHLKQDNNAQIRLKPNNTQKIVGKGQNNAYNHQETKINAYLVPQERLVVIVHNF
jgi:hypothetical protein